LHRLGYRFVDRMQDLSSLQRLVLIYGLEYEAEQLRMQMKKGFQDGGVESGGRRVHDLSELVRILPKTEEKK